MEHPSIRVLMEKEKDVLLSRGTFSDKMYESVQTLGYVSHHDDDHLLSENVVFLSLMMQVQVMPLSNAWHGTPRF